MLSNEMNGRPADCSSKYRCLEIILRAQLTHPGELDLSVIVTVPCWWEEPRCLKVRRIRFISDMSFDRLNAGWAVGLMLGRGELRDRGCHDR